MRLGPRLIALLLTCTTLTVVEGSVAATTLRFPRDYGAHCGYPREWWSLTAHVIGPRERRFSLQASFFRFTVAADEDSNSAEYSIVDESTERVDALARAARNVGCSATPTRDTIAVDDWHLSTNVRHERMSAGVGIGDSRNGFSLKLDPKKRPVPSLGFEGYALTRLSAEGWVSSEGSRYRVSGSAWIDHEYETPQAAGNRVGWQRFELQLDDGYEIELFSSRLADGAFRLPSRASDEHGCSAVQTDEGVRDPIEGFTVTPSGRRRMLAQRDVELVIAGNTFWHSPHDEASYPAIWQLTIAGRNDAIAVTPTVRDQELLPGTSGVALWFGSVDLAQAGPPGDSLGAGFVQLTGFATPTPL